MARIFITGSTDGIGLLAAEKLLSIGHEVLLHARNESRGKHALYKLPAAQGFLTGDLSDIAETKQLADKVNAFGKLDAVIHNAGVFKASAREIFTVNTLAPYILTSLIQKPERLVYISSAMHLQGQAKLDSFKTAVERITYSDTKLHVLMLVKAVAKGWPGIYVNAVNPGWVPTKMGGAGAPDNLDFGAETQAWLAVSEEPNAKVTGNYFFHKRIVPYNPIADNETDCENLLRLCAEITGVAFQDK